MLRHRIVISWTAFNVWWLKISCGVDYEISGLENMNKVEKPFVVLSKHQSTWETLLLQSLFFPASTVLKSELLRIPFFGWGLLALRPIGIDRDDPIKALKKVKTEGVKRVNSGLNLILFPEGTRVKVGQKNKYARSGADIALKAKAPILPVAHNAGEHWPIDSKVKIPGTIKVSIGQPIHTEGKNSKQIIAEVEEWIETEMEKISAQQK